jgi:hypothetical protein
MFLVHQGTGAYTLTWEEPKKVYAVDSEVYDGSSTYAYQSGWIMADEASVFAGSSIPQGFSSLIAGSVDDGSMNFHMGTTAGQNAIFAYGLPDSNYKTTTSGEIEARGDSGTAVARSTGPNGQYANVNASFERIYCTWKAMDFDLSASGKIYSDGDTKIKTENEVYRPHGYSGDVTATNSVDTEGDSVDFVPWHHNYGGVAGLTSSGGEWAVVWPRSHR